MLQCVEAVSGHAEDDAWRADPWDSYIRSKKAAAAEPRRQVVELSPAEYRALETACRGRCLTAPELVRLVALRVARVV
jgi:hypothetical protein